MAKMTDTSAHVSERDRPGSISHAAPPGTHLRQLLPSLTRLWAAGLLKLYRMRLIKVLALLELVLYFFVLLLLHSSTNERFLDRLDPHAFLQELLSLDLSYFDAAAGLLLLIAAARLVALEYSSGTIRVLLGQGIHRGTLLASQLLALLTVGLALLLGSAIISFMGGLWLLGAWGTTTGIAIIPILWPAILMAMLLGIVSIVACNLIGMSAAAIGRSMPFAMGAALGFFPADNLGTPILRVLSRLSGIQWVGQVPRFLLGPSLNHLPEVAWSGMSFSISLPQPPGNSPLLPTAITIAVWLGSLTVIATGMTLFRDVLE